MAFAPDALLEADGGAPLDAERAKALAVSLHRGQRDAAGTPLIDHVRRVAAAVPTYVGVVAWLHEVLEHTPLPEEALLEAGLSTDELRAIRLLSRSIGSRSDANYLAHVDLIARARGKGAWMARIVKRADLTDRMTHPSIRADGWCPPYARALEIIDA
jgi:hypothetical protein